MPEVGIKQGLKFGGLYGYIDLQGFGKNIKIPLNICLVWNELTSVEAMGSSAGFMFLNTEILVSPVLMPLLPDLQNLRKIVK